tara:strand:+ start:1736 stop:2329 length:594 start_codon:yes stop_codon:yes gene_type:complete
MIRDRELIYHDRCCCLNTDSNPIHSECRKRYYHIYDLVNQKYVNIAVCNDLIRLEMAKNSVESYCCRSSYEDVVNDIVIQHVDVSGFVMPKYNRNDNDLFSRSITIEACSRPYMYHSMSIIDAIEIGNTNDVVKDACFNSIKEYLSTKLYKKYKIKYAKCIKLCNDLKKYMSQEERDIMVNQLFNSILELKIKSATN